MKKVKTNKWNAFKAPRRWAMLLTVACTTMYSTAFAQPCKTDTLVINSGYNYTTTPATAVALGAADPEWDVIFVSNDVRNAHIAAGNPALPATPFNAVRANGGSGWASGGNAYPSSWISFANPATWYSTVQNGDYRVTFRRTFTLCESATFDFNPQMARDNYITNMVVAGSTYYSDPIANWGNTTNWSALFSPGGMSMILPAGTYNIDITVANFHPSGGSSSGANPHGLKFLGTLFTYNGAKSFRQNGFTSCDCPQEPCSDECYWKVKGNNILNGNNIFGTLTNNDVRIQTWANNRGIIKGGSATMGGFLGWNTMNPTARLHVNCANGNQETGLSDIRFENLESGNGTLLAIDAQGYVYNTGKTLPGTSGTAWDVTGNTITGGNNIFGTNSRHDVILRTSGIDKGILTSGTAGIPFDDGRLGWQTLNPTAHLHVNCRQGNPDDGGNGSDVRFEELERGEGYIMVIDKEGYVYNSFMRLTPDGGIEIGGKKDNRIQELENEVADLKAKLNELLNCCSSATSAGTVTPGTTGSKLFQNTPNPFGKETVIEYDVQSMQQSAFIMIYDLNGRELSRIPILKHGHGQVSVNGDNMIAGMYLYSLVIDGKEIDSKRMVLTK